MWKFSNLNSGYNHWPPDVGQQQLNLESFISPAYTNAPVGRFSRNSIAPFSDFGVKSWPNDLNSDFAPRLNSHVYNPDINYAGVNPSTPTKRFLVFDLSGDHRSLIFSSVPNPFQTLHPSLPSSNASYAFVANSHCGIEKQEEMHEDTDEIDALLYSDSEFSFDSEEASTGHSPLKMKDDDITSYPIATKRRKLNLNHSAIDESLLDTASSTRAFNFPQTPSFDNADISYVSNLDDESRDENGKRGRIQTIIKALRRIIPGGDAAMDTVTVLDEAICYLKSLKVLANSLDYATASI